MNIKGNNIFSGAYAERYQQKFQFNQTPLSEEKKDERIQQIKAAMNEVNWSTKKRDGIQVTFSQEDLDFLCSEKGLERIKKDAEDFYLKNAEQQKAIASDRDQGDPFWGNTGNQWLIFSEFLNDNDFYKDMDDEAVQKMETTLAKITAGMDHISRNQYSTGLDFSDYYGKDSNFFMTATEAAMELESSTNALKYFSEKFVSVNNKDKFESLINSYSNHNTTVLKEYNNPAESFNRALNALYKSIGSGKNPNSALINDNISDKKCEEFSCSLILGGINKTEENKQRFIKNLSVLFEQLKLLTKDKDSIWKEIKNIYIDFASDGNDNKKLKEYIQNQSTSTFKRMQGYWSGLILS